MTEDRDKVDYSPRGMPFPKRGKFFLNRNGYEDRVVQKAANFPAEIATAKSLAWIHPCRSQDGVRLERGLSRLGPAQVRIRRRTGSPVDTARAENTLIALVGSSEELGVFRAMAGEKLMVATRSCETGDR